MEASQFCHMGHQRQTSVLTGALGQAEVLWTERRDGTGHWAVLSVSLDVFGVLHSSLLGPLRRWILGCWPSHGEEANLTLAASRYNVSMVRG